MAAGWTPSGTKTWARCPSRRAIRATARPWLPSVAVTTRHWALTLCRSTGFEPDVRFESTDLLLHLRLVEQGHAAALLPDLVWDGRPATVPLQQLPHGGQARRLFTAIRRGRGRHLAIQACRRALREAVGASGPPGAR
ncbi:LysR substrate-binding domain-containing protein [Streptomyces sp. ID38640]|uniref:LysR substrate-binding domain-containing protein n=1 Tax=Streptomyces sp. ID38640 TaxID=1265399 RepID=UPI0037DA6EC7